MNYSNIPIIFKDLDKNNQFLTYLISIKKDHHFENFLKVFIFFLFQKKILIVYFFILKFVDLFLIRTIVVIQHVTMKTIFIFLVI